MEKLKIKKLNPILKFKIACWSRFKGQGNYDRIKEYMLTPGMFTYMYKNENRKPKNNDGKVFEYVLKKKNKVLAYTRVSIDYIFGKPNLFVRGIITHPMEERKGYASQLLKRILDEPKKFLKVEPEKMYANVAADNFQSKKMFSKIGKTRYAGSLFGLDVLEIDLNGRTK